MEKQSFINGNFVLSSGCDIPAAAKWENVDMFYKASANFYKGN